jgi:Lipocalin-like domain
MTAEDLRSNIIGTWTLVTSESTALDGTDLSYPLGADARGIIMYTADGYMSAHIMRSDRNRFAGEDLHQASDDEYASAAKGYISYSGPYAVLDGGLIAHHVQLSLLPNRVGHTQYRATRLEDSHLELATSEPMEINGAQRNARLVWRRADALEGGANPG